MELLVFQPQQAGRFLSGLQAGAVPSGKAPVWIRLVETAQREGVAAVVFHHITSHRLDDLIPDDCLRAFADRYRDNLKRNLSIVGALRRVLAAFERQGLPCIVLKGIALAEHVYPNIALRGMSDIDLLVRKADLFRVDEQLHALEYRPRDSTAARAVHNPAGYLASLDYRKDDDSGLSLHVHWHPVNSSVPATMFAGQVDLDRLWGRAVAAGVADSPVLTLCPEHLIIYLCEHAMRVGHSFDRLILVCDILFAVRRFQQVLDWDFIVEESRRFNLSRFVYHGLSIVGHHAAADIPGSILTQLRPSDLSQGEKYFLRLQYRNRRVRGSSYFVYLAMNRGLSAKVRFLARTLFPPFPILLQRQYLTDAKGSTSLYLRRIGEVFSHLAAGLTSAPMKRSHKS